MKFSGKELFDLGVPQNKIKLFIGREFNNSDELLEELKPKEHVKVEKVFTWIDWCFQTLKPYEIPSRNPDEFGKTSKSELKRIFDSGSVEINGKFPNSTDECCDEDFPLTSLVWFPKSTKRKTTVIGYDEEFKAYVEDRDGIPFQDYLWWNSNY